ncbi:MAG: hypothetical protein CMJ18_00740 [Phycisphaeraceae bacterium]|nr:hypothetical protein [Phycisphaeraceae bacterium]
MGRHQAYAFSRVRSARIVAGADPFATGRKAFAAQHPGAMLYEDHRKLLKDTNVDAVVIAVPTGHHKAVTIDALRSGRPVLVEKPAARTVAQVRRMIEQARRSRKLLMVAQCRRYDPIWGVIAAQLRKNRIGRPVLWRHVSAGRGPGGWFMDDRMGGGPLLDGAVHDHDFCNWMFGDPVSVMARGIKLNPGVTASDTVSASVQYASGDQSMFSWSWCTPGGGVHDLLGPKGSLIGGPGDLVVPKAKAGRPVFCHTDMKGRQKLLFPSSSRSMYENQARHFIECVEKGIACRSPATESVKAVAVGDAILKAAVRGGVRRVSW